VNPWTTSREQWVSWIEETRVVVTPLAVLDAWDGQFHQVLNAAAFGQSSEATTASALVLDPLATYDSMPTMIRSADLVGDEDVDAAQTLVHGTRPEILDADDAPDASSALEVKLESAQGALQIELDPPPTAGDWYIPPLTERSTVGPAPQPPQPPPPPAAAVPEPVPPTDSARTVISPAPSAQTVVAPSPIAAGDAAVLGPPPPFDQPISAVPPVAVRTGTTLIPTEPDAANTQTSGEIVTVADLAPEVPAPRRPSKIVVAPPPDAVAVTDADPEPDVLESSDLLETMEPVEAPEPVGGPPRPPAMRPLAPPPPPDAVRESTGSRSSGEIPAYITGQTLPPAGPRHWSESVFAAHFAALTRAGADRVAQAEVEFIASVTVLPVGASVVDVGCGEGRHANAFSERGHRTVGLDASEAQLRLATDVHGPSVPKLRWVCQDVRDRGLGEQFDLVTCLGTTLGIYDETQNRAVLQALRDLCAPSGRVVLHVSNRDYVVPRLPARTWWQGQGCLVLDEVDVHDPSSRINVKRTIVFEDGRQFEHVYDVRLYAVHELVAACEAVGLTVLEVSGSRHTRARFFGATSPDIWLVARR